MAFWVEDGMLEAPKKDRNFGCTPADCFSIASMHHIIYMSQAKEPFNTVELVVLLAQARIFNAQHSITGSLIYGNGQFMQVLEGEQAVISALYERIAADSRHEAVVKLVDMPLAKRSFSQWSMAFHELSPEHYEDLLGYVMPHQWEQLTRGVQSVNAPLLAQMHALLTTSRSSAKKPLE